MNDETMRREMKEAVDDGERVRISTEEELDMAQKKIKVQPGKTESK